MMNVKEVKAIIGEALVDGAEELIVLDACEWANCQDARVDANGNIWIEGYRLNDEKIVEFHRWTLLRIEQLYL